MSLQEAIYQRIIESGGKLTVKSALNPMLWLCTITIPPGMLGLKYMPRFAPVFELMICLPIITTIVSSVVLLFIDRDKLQSEEYQIRKLSIEMMEQKGDVGPTLIKVGPVATNPELQSPATVLLTSELGADSAGSTETGTHE